MAIGEINVPNWHELCQGTPAPSDEDIETSHDSEYRKGWQYRFSNAIEKAFAGSHLQSLTPTGKAVMRSCAGAHSAAWLTAIPHEEASSFDDVQFRCGISRRLGLPVNPLAGLCPACQGALDEFGYHRTTCMRTGLAHARHRVIVATWRRIFKEAGTNIPDRNVERYIRDTHLRNSPVDGRRLDLVSQGISGVFGGKPLFMDATCISPVRGSGVPTKRAATRMRLS